MDLPVGTDIPVFKICGFSIPLVGVNLPTSVTVKHFKSKAHRGDDIVMDISTYDVTIKIGEKTFQAHKEFLISKIPFFRDLFNAYMVECTNGVINLSTEFCGFNLTTLEILLGYVYNGCLTISTENVQDLMLGASFLRIESVMDECSEFMKRRLTVENIFPILYFCRSIAYDKIKSDINKFIDKNFVYLSQTAEFLEMNFEDLMFFLKRDTLYVDDEKQIFECVSRWIENDMERRQYAARLLDNVRCNLFSDSFVAVTVEKTDWVVNSPDCITLVDKAKKNVQDKKIDHRMCEDRHVLFFAYRGGSEPRNNAFSFQLYDPITNLWTNPKNNRPSKHLFDRTEPDGYNIFFRRTLRKEIHEPGEEWLEMYNTLTDEWHTDRKTIEQNVLKFPEYISTVRDGSTLEVIDGKLYMAGGLTNDKESLSSLDTYDDVSHEWKTIGSMSTTRYNHCSEVVGGKLYVFGGIGDDADSLSSGECYDPENGRWQMISSMKDARFSFESVTYNNQIYVFGGCDDTKWLDTVEKYDPLGNSWITLKRMRRKRSNTNAGVSCGKIFLFGTVDSRTPTKRINTVDMYDPETDTWEVRKPMTYDCVFTPISVPASYPSPIANLENIWISEFRYFSLKTEILKAIVECGFMHPTKVQSEFLPQAIAGKDFICEVDAKGKTSSFIISTLQQLEPSDGQTSVLILVPSRVVASKIEKEFKRFSKYLEPIKVAAFFGGVSIKHNKEYLENNYPHIVIGTPIRLLELIQSNALNIGNIKHFVLDECDQMMGNPRMCSAVTNIFKFAVGPLQILSFNVLNNKTKHKLQNIYESEFS